MRLTWNVHHVQSVAWGEPTALTNGTLQVDREALSRSLLSDQRLADVVLVLAQPGESCRIQQVWDILEPRCKVDAGNVDFPGALGPVRSAGSGTTRVLRGLAATILDPTSPDPGHVIDLAHSALPDHAPAEVTPYAGLAHVVILPSFAPNLSSDEQTLVCGDNYFADNPNAADECLELVRQLRPDVLLAGPAFNAGRYGVACGALCRRVSDELKIPAVTGMYPENPGADLYHADVIIVRTSDNAATMRNVLSTMLGLARKLRAGETLRRPSVEGYIPQGKVRTEYRSASAAERAADMLLAKLHGAAFETEVPLPTFNPPPAPAALPDRRGKKVALVTDGGLVPKGNPDNLESTAAKSFKSYSIAGKQRLDAADYDVSHGGYDNRYVRQDPNRLVPVDAARQLEREGSIGQLFDEFLTTCGLANPVQNSRQLGQGMADYLKQAGVEAVILTST